MKLTKDYVIEGKIVRAGAILDLQENTTPLDEGIVDFFKKIFIRNPYIVDFDFDVPDAYSTSDGDLIGYYAYLSGGAEIRLNYLMDGNNDKLFSVDYIADGDAYDKPSRSILLDPDASNKEINDAVNDLISNNLQEGIFSTIEKRFLERVSPAKDEVYAWIEDPEWMDARLDIIQDEKLARVYTEYARTVEGRPVSQASFITYTKQYLNNNGLSNKWTRGAYTPNKPKKMNPIITPSEQTNVTALASNSDMIFGWKEAFGDMEDDFEELLDDQENMPYGQLVYGSGGSGKSYFYVNEAHKYDAEIIKGAPNTARLVRILYDYRDKEVIIFDDADSIVTTANSANILKMALDDTAEGRVIYLPKSSGADLKGIEPDVYDTDGNLVQAFHFNASIVIITNLGGLKNTALRSRLYLNPIFMTKEDIIEKIMLTVDPSSLGASEADSRMVADFLVTLVQNDDLDITNDQLSYRFFKIGLKLRKRYPDNWTGKLLRKLGIGIRSSYKDLK
jgi:hypothetical protein